MPNYYNAPGAAAADSIFGYLADEDNRKHQQLIDQITQKREERLAKSEDLDMLFKQEQLKATREDRAAARAEKAIEGQRKVAKDALDAHEKKVNEFDSQVTKNMMPGDYYTPNQIQTAKDLGISLQMTPEGRVIAPRGQDAPMLPNPQPVPTTGDLAAGGSAILGQGVPDAAATQASAILPGAQPPMALKLAGGAYLGNAVQRQKEIDLQKVQEMIANPDTPDGVRHYLQVRSALPPGENPPASLFEKADTQTEGIFRQNPKSGSIDRLVDGQWTPWKGDAPKGAHFMTVPTPAQGTEMPPLEPATMDMLAKAVATKGLSALTGLGWGNASVKMKEQIINRAAQFNEGTGTFVEGNTNTVNLAGNEADYKARQGALTQLQRNHSAVNAFSNTASLNADRLKDIIKQVPDVGIPLLNQPIRTIDARLFGSENVAALRVLQQSVKNEYARLISQPNLTGVLSDNARKEMEEIISGDMTVSMMNRVLNELAAEAHNRASGFETEIDNLRKGVRGVTPTDQKGSSNAPRVRTYNPATGKLE